jgi:hypothetical protein
MLKILLLLFSAALACGVHDGSGLRVDEGEDRGGLVVTVESNPDDPGEESTSTAFEAARAPGDWTRLTDEEGEEIVGPDYGRYPDPFAPTTTLHFRVSNQDSVRIRMYDSKRIFVAELLAAPLQAGTHLLKIMQPEAWDIPAGVYFCVVEIGVEKKLVKRMLLLK